jgi:hypothetical protein
VQPLFIKGRPKPAFIFIVKVVVVDVSLWITSPLSKARRDGVASGARVCGKLPFLK